jgi:hypothetical protein
MGFNLPGAGIDTNGLITFLKARQGNEHILEDAEATGSSVKIIKPEDPHSFLLPGFIGELTYLMHVKEPLA